MTGRTCTDRPQAAAARYALRHAALDLAPLDSAVPSARLHARLVLLGWGYADLASDGELIVSELVTNAARHARQAATRAGPPPVRLRLTEQAAGVQIDVWDGCGAMPQPGPSRTPDDDAEGGRGLFLVAAYAARWGTYATAGGGKVVWAVLAR